MSGIQITINGEKHFLETNVSLANLLDRYKIKSEHIAVAVNDAIIPFSERAEWRIQNGDRIELVRAVAGG